LTELEQVVFEVSVLKPPEKIQVTDPREYVKKIKVGEDGLIVEKNGCKGLLLPQVPLSGVGVRKNFCVQCCYKAGIPFDSW
jgi:uncharacterized protein (TIGR00296 family)